MEYTELQVTSNFSFLRGGSHPHELVAHAQALGYTSIAITDRNTMAGIVRAHSAAKKAGIRLIVGVRLDLQDSPSLLAYPTNKDAYASLCNLLTTGNLCTEKGDCRLFKADVFQCTKGIIFIVLPPDELNQQFVFDPGFDLALQEYKAGLRDQLYIAAWRSYQGNDSKRLFRIQQLSQRYGIPMVATNDVHYHDLARRQLQDVLTCIREKCTIHNAGYRLHPNAERHLKDASEMTRLFRQYPDAIRCTQTIAAACQFSLDDLKYEYPEGLTSEGRTAQEQLEYLTWQGARERYGETIPEKVVAAIHYELAYIKEVDYAKYFLTVEDIVSKARSLNILCQGRGSAANSTVCYVLGITSVDPTKFDLLFERFISRARNEPPDIDVDFEHERREEIIQYIYEKYGRDHAAIVATVTQQHQKGSIRDVGRAMGLSVDTVNRLSRAIWEFTDEWFDESRLVEQGLNPQDPHLLKVLKLTHAFMGFPRQLGQHTGGFVITKGKLHELCPIINARMEGRTNLEWNKDDIDDLGFLKIDVLGLGMLTCLRKAFDLAKQHYGLGLTLYNIPQDDPAVYDMICKADTIGVFQIESRAQQSMLPRLKPRNFYDLVIEVAIVRPGPILGDMVHPYLKRRNGEEPVEYPSKELEDILKKTLGVPLFQEQAMKIAIVAAGFTPTEADELRRSMATFKLKGLVSQFEQKLISGMIMNGYTLDYAQRVFRQLEGFGSYGFPESHAASFAHLVWVSCWLKCHYPDVFACALLNSQPMGFYQPAQIVADAKRHGVEVRPVDVNYSAWDNQLEEKVGNYYAMRLGFRQVKGLRKEDIEILVGARHQPFETIDQLREAGVPVNALEALAEADAFRSIQMDRRQALWQVSTKDHPVALFAGKPSENIEDEERVTLPEMKLSEHVLQDYASTALSLKAHPVSFVREKLQQLKVITSADLFNTKPGSIVRVSGLVLVRQRPGTAGGVCFMTIEDETGTANIIIFQNLFEEFRKPILQSRLIMIEGEMQRQGDVIHVVAIRCHNFSKLLRNLGPDIALLNNSETGDTLPAAMNKKAQVRQKAPEISFPEARNFK
ncbi:MAG: error-prone DNA polymerase [Pseudobacter sp.]|uniref:error-prone DNA polymerase n=1 Tax=Pseudobacter sp. TaxID=2045420 RepID=UPI003F7E85F5